MAVSARGDIVVALKADGTGQLTIAADALDKLAGASRKAGTEAETFASSFKSLAAGMTVGNLAAQAITATLGTVRSAIADVVKNGLEWDDVVKGNEQAARGMVSATNGLLDAMTAARAKIQLTSGDLKLNQEQLEAVAKAAVEFARINGGTVKDALESVIQMVRSGSEREFKKLGIQLDLTGDAAHKTSQAIDEITKRFGGMRVELQDSGEQLESMSSSWNTLTGSIGNALVQSKLFTGAVELMRDTIKGWDNILFSNQSRLSEVRQELAHWNNELAKLKTGGVWDKLFGEDPEFVEGKLKALNRELNTLLSTAKTQTKTEQNKMILPTQEIASDVLRKKITKQKKVEKDILDEFAEKEAKDEAFRKSGRDLLSSMTPQDPRSASTESTQFVGFGKEIDIFKRHGMSEAFIEFKLQAGEARDAWTLFAGDLQAQTQAGMFGMVTDGLYSMAGGIWNAIDAAVSGQTSFGVAIARMTKAVLMGVAAESTVMALKELALAFGSLFLNPAKAAAHFKSAALWGAAGIAAGVGGIAIGSAVASGSSSRVGGTDASRSSAPRSSGVRPSSSGGGKENNQPLNVQVFIGPKNDPAAALWMRKQQLLDIGGLKAA